MRIFLITAMVFFFSSLGQAEEPTAPARAPAASKVINEDDAPAPTTKASLSDLRDQQIENENAAAETRENTANPDVNTDPDACTAMDIAGTMQVPANLRDVRSSPPAGKPQIRGSGYTISGSDDEEHKPSKMALCKASYEKMNDACYKGMPCSGCEDALKTFTTTCGYVGREESDGSNGIPGGSGGEGGGRTLDGRRNVPVNKLPQR